MSGGPFGFRPPGGGDDEDRSEGENAANPFAALFGGAGGVPSELADKVPLFAELQKLMSWQGGPVNWDLARQTAIQAAAEGDVPLGAGDTTAVSEALRLADHWLDPVTALPSGGAVGQAWTRVAWIENTLEVWARLCDPVASRVVAAMRPALDPALPEEAHGMTGPLLGVMNQVGGLIFGLQVGQALGSLGREVVGVTDIGLPLAAQAALLPTNVAAFGAGLSIPADQVRLYLALREAAHQRLFAHVPWLRAHLLDAVDAYARGITVDTEAIQQVMGQLDPTGMDPQQLQEALGGGLFEPQTTDAQKAALARLETALALVEGWVDEVASAAAEGHLPAAVALRETVRRRRASGGPAEQTFATLVGLELRPRRLREAATLWQALLLARGIDGRDALWGHPDLLPTAEDLNDPTGFAARRTDAASQRDADFDAAVEQLGRDVRGED